MRTLSNAYDYGVQADILKGNLLGYKRSIFKNLMADFLCKISQLSNFFSIGKNFFPNWRKNELLEVKLGYHASLSQNCFVRKKTFYGEVSLQSVERQ